MKRVLIGVGVACAVATGLVVLAAPQSTKPASPAPAASPSPAPPQVPPAGGPPGLPPGPGAAAAPAPLKPEDEAKVLYAIGYVLGRETGVFALNAAEAEEVKKGFADFLAGKEAQVTLDTYGPQIRPFAQTRLTRKTDVEKEKGRAFAEQAAKEPGATKADSGLVYIEKSKGTGASPKPTDKVKVHYHGTFTDGKVFDTTQGRDPAELNVNGVIPCWTEGLQKMAVGGKARLVCPSTIAYGDTGRPGMPGGATLVFDVELVEILPATAAAAPPAPPAAAPPAVPAPAARTPSTPAKPAGAAKPPAAVKPAPKPSPSPKAQ
jgi:FKBP-type peptidyl-prolyl cis-trans isomerase FkpA